MIFDMITLSGHLDACLDELGHTDVQSMDWIQDFLNHQVKGDPPMTDTAVHELTFASSTIEVMDAAFEAAMKLPSGRDMQDSAHLTSSTIRLRHMMENMHAICVAGFSADALAGYLLGELNNAGMRPSWHNYKVIDPSKITRPEFEPSPPPQAPAPTEPEPPAYLTERLAKLEQVVAQLTGRSERQPPVPSEEGQLLLDAVRGFQSHADSAAEADEGEWYEAWLNRMRVPVPEPTTEPEPEPEPQPEESCSFKLGDWVRWSLDPDAWVLVEFAPTGRMMAIKVEGDRGVLRYFYLAHYDQLVKIEPGS